MSIINVHKINPYIRVAMNSVLSQGRVINKRVILDYELVYVERGRFLLTYADESFECKEGDFIFIRPGIPHSFDCRYEDLYQPHIHFDMTYSQDSHARQVSFKDLPDMSAEEKNLISKDLFAPYPPNPLIKFEDKDTALSLFYETIPSHRNNASLTKKAAMLELINMIITDNFPNCFSGGEDNNVVRICEHVKNYIDSGQALNMSLSDFEKQFSYNKYYLDRLFKKQYNVGLISYRNKQKMLLACQLLRTESVTAVAEKLYFSSIYSFSRAFKNEFGVSPIQYKINNK
ncbi:MAG: helix-turn-helix domain-containing protein [Clostridia bacterium]|nr:helix-turn-helix domain-containing protein [Clostridia bacterium]